MRIKFDKTYENDIAVTYLIETEVLDELSRQVKYNYVKALCTFNKETEEINFDQNKTDPYYFSSKKEPASILRHLRKLNRTQKSFPDIYDIITC